ncbi:hypothetical protein GGR50DRAFT_142851 [Xylaria sp. CBS 124048]|nr:hypothetical protein GGR50DRAFT_142851 [Xylaria sp. CBS 124048]
MSQVLVAAFSFGVLFNTAFTALTINVKSHGSAIYRDRLRLVLVSFLLTSSFWSVVEFLATLVNPTASSVCWVAVIFSSLFDQLGRVLVELYLSWVVPRGDVKPIFSAIPKILIFLRFCLGIAFAAVNRTQFNPTCAAVSSVRGVSIATVALDAAIISLLSALACSETTANKDLDFQSMIIRGAKTERFTLAGVVVWWVTSVASSLGLEETDLFYKTALPGIGLTVLIVMILSQTFTVPRELPRNSDPPVPWSVRDLSSSGSIELPPSRYEFLKRTSSAPISTLPSKKWGVKLGAKTGKPTISKPILDWDDEPKNSIRGIPVIGLVEAAKSQKQRRDEGARRTSTDFARGPVPRPSASLIPSIVITEPPQPEESEKSELGKITEAPDGLSVEHGVSSTDTQVSYELETIQYRIPRTLEPATLGTTLKLTGPCESVQIPIQNSPEWDQDSPLTTSDPIEMSLQHFPYTGLPPENVQTPTSLATNSSNRESKTAMFVSKIVYNDPSAVSEIVEEVSKTTWQPSGSRDSILNRPRPIPRHGDRDRQVFPAEIHSNHQRTRSTPRASFASQESIQQLILTGPSGLPSQPEAPSRTTIATKDEPNITRSLTLEDERDIPYSIPLSSSPAIELGTRRPSRDSGLPAVSTIHEDKHFYPTIDDSSDLEPNGETVGDDYLLSADLGRKTSPTLAIQDEARFGDEYTTADWSPSPPTAAIASSQNSPPSHVIEDSRDLANYEEIPIMMMDESFEGQSHISLFPDFERDPDQPTSESPIVARRFSRHFHHRVGDECPTFSARKDKTRPRKMPPPTPLRLGGPTDFSPVSSSSGVTSDIILAEQRRFERYIQESEEDTGHRLTLLTKIEDEMEHLTAKRRPSCSSHFSEDILLNIQVPSSPKSRSTPEVPELSRPPSQHSPVIASPIPERRISLQAIMKDESVEEALFPSSPSSIEDIENSQATLRESVLSETPLESAEHEPDVSVGFKDWNITSTSRTHARSLSCPESDGSLEGRQITNLIALNSTDYMPQLWSQKILVSREKPTSWLWEPQTQTAKRNDLSFHDMPGPSIRQTVRRHLSPLRIESWHLWRNASERMPKQLPAAQIPVPIRPSAHPVPVRRPRRPRRPQKPRRMSLLPDIIEDPSPLPNKRNTLGIFRFPWGERSEHATPFYRSSSPAPRATPKTTTPARDFTSFFDDADDDDDQTNGNDDADSSDASNSGDDEFDETMIWEIVSLLRTVRIQSPPPPPPPPPPSEPRRAYTTPEESNDELVGDHNYKAALAPPPAGFESVSSRGDDGATGPSLLWVPKHVASGNNLGLPQRENWRRDERGATGERKGGGTNSSSNSKGRPRALSENDIELRWKNTPLWSSGAGKR